MAGYTFAEKALARAAGLPAVRVGQIVDARPDIVLSHDNTAAIYQTFKKLGLSRVKYPERLAITLDHAVPAPSTQHAQNHAEVRRFVREQGVQHFFEAGRGICHQVLSEEAIVLPGELILGADSHTTHFGWLGAFGAGVGRSEVAALWATGELWLRVPESMKVIVTGTWRQGVTAKDFCLKLIGDLGVEGGIYMSIEFHGEAISALSLDSRAVIPNMMAEFGAKTAYLPPDQAIFDYLAPRARRPYTPIYPDPDAEYIAVHHYDVSTLEPMIACPDSPDNVQPLSAVAGTPVQQAFIGTCTNGRLEDLAAAAAVLKGRKVASGTRLLVIPASSTVLKAALERGYIQTFVEAGAMIGVPGCGPCMGNHMGIPAPAEVTISSANRNFRGRMGTTDAPIYLANPAVVAASAVTGAITDPMAL
ncbi:MAG: 3-isopropylmalate dehydratase large subunit [Candidatus Thermofonsia Clade 1 bacterium]|uniref:3-isopropylmalate dehydratase large subunit n=1 Tax=Candidatus Thermofonsia Clade 1 bacterium TaxID=2364210 RepID=A0A2M8PI56_9CHLR|nr:MAG: 3-isopropylmalate dehydratase large subunit [Candidatus Thermofonsia Clade 1 bacterium]